MSLFAIVLNEADQRAWDRITENWPQDHYFLTDRAAFVGTSGDELPKDISDTLGMNSEERIQGFVVPADLIAGWNDTRLKKWMDEHR